jgi:tetratricopeptide (TPR) repeat protein
VKAARFLWVFVAGCSLGQPDRERLGDAAWHEARWADAIADYRAAGDSPRLTAKLADAALQGGLLAESAQAWTKLGTDAPERSAEAAAGLARVADAAEHEGKQAALAQAIAGLRRVAPAWPLGRVASRLGEVGVVLPVQAPDVIPAMLAAATDHDAAGPLLLALGQADRVRGACEAAVPILEGVLRRTMNAGLHDTAATALELCELGLGLGALQGPRPGDAERWLDRAVRRDPQGAVGRRAQVALGDARLRQGDTVAARSAWQLLVTSAAPPDSVTQLALLRLQAVTPTLPDSGTLHPVRP